MSSTLIRIKSRYMAARGVTIGEARPRLRAMSKRWSSLSRKARIKSSCSITWRTRCRLRSWSRMIGRRRGCSRQVMAPRLRNQSSWRFAPLSRKSRVGSAIRTPAVVANILTSRSSLSWWITRRTTAYLTRIWLTVRRTRMTTRIKAQIRTVSWFPSLKPKIGEII